MPRTDVPPPPGKSAPSSLPRPTGKRPAGPPRPGLDTTTIKKGDAVEIDPSTGPTSPPQLITSGAAVTTTNSGPPSPNSPGRPYLVPPLGGSNAEITYLRTSSGGAGSGRPFGPDGSPADAPTNARPDTTSTGPSHSSSSTSSTSTGPDAGPSTHTTTGPDSTRSPDPDTTTSPDTTTNPRPDDVESGPHPGPDPDPAPAPPTTSHWKDVPDNPPHPYIETHTSSAGTDPGDVAHYGEHALSLKAEADKLTALTPKPLGKFEASDGIKLQGLYVTDWGKKDPNKGVWHMSNSVHPASGQPNFYDNRTGKNSNLTDITRDPGSDSTPVYYLPWDSRGGTVYMDIPPGGPDFFHTANLSGCSVFVSGSPKNPRVYHCGVDGNFSENGSFTRPPGVDSIDIWRASVKNEEIRAIRNGPDAEINRYDYMSTNVDGKTEKFTARTQELENNLKRVTGDPNAMAMSNGSVFGKRDAEGNWSFYLQENVTLIFNGRKEHRPVQLTKFYPNHEVMPSTWQW